MKEEVGSGEGWEESRMDAEHVYTRLGKFAGANRAETRNSRRCSYCGFLIYCDSLADKAPHTKISYLHTNTLQIE